MKSRPQESTNNAGAKIAAAGKQTLNKLSAEVQSLPSKDTANYKVAAAASAVFALGSLFARAAGNTVSYYFDVLAATFSAGVAANQYGLLDSVKPTITNTYSSLFANKTPAITAKAVEAEVEQSSSRKASPLMARPV